VWKNSQNDRSRKSRFRAPNLICASNRHDEAHGRATRGKIARAAEALPNFPSRPSMAVQIVIDAKNRVFPHNPSIRDVAQTSQMRNSGRSAIEELDHPPRLFHRIVDDRLICEAGSVLCQCAASRHSPIKKKARADRERRPRDRTQSQAGRSCHRGLRRQTLFYESMNPTAARSTEAPHRRRSDSESSTRRRLCRRPSSRIPSRRMWPTPA
jgi:hypothetical protein